jgi:Fic family protein
LSANLESFLTKSITAKNLLLKDLNYKAQAEKLEREMRDTNNKIKKLEQTKLTPAAPAAQSKNKTEEKKAEEAKKIADAQEAKKKQLATLTEHYVKLEDQLKDAILKMLDTFRGYIGEDLRHVWDDIISSKYGTKTWTNLQGVEYDDEELVLVCRLFRT